jgi:hypothetical protein
MPRDITGRFVVFVLLGFAIWGSWFYALYRGIVLKKLPNRGYWAWLVTFGCGLLVGTVLVLRYSGLAH